MLIRRIEITSLFFLLYLLALWRSTFGRLRGAQPAESSASWRSALDPNGMAPAGSACRRRRLGWARNRLHRPPGRPGRLDASLAPRPSVAGRALVIRSRSPVGAAARPLLYRKATTNTRKLQAAPK